jgi:2-polyprenyl-3-methyl-5-hydroxy-6-metoxy-1,4-benzoquinol methylase
LEQCVTAASVPEWGYASTEPLCSSPYLLPVLKWMLGPGNGRRVLDLGCGNGYNARFFLEWGFKVVGVDPSEEGIRIARSHYPTARFEVMAVEDDLLERLGEAPFDAVVSTEVVEHLYDPAAWARCCFESVKPGGIVVASTPYHGYLKNLSIALLDGFDKHVQPMEHGGHIKFWSRRTLGALLTQAGFEEPGFAGAGRLPLLWKSMVMTGKRPR